MASDFMKIAVAEVASLSERRLFRLLSSHLSGKLPPFAQPQGRHRALRAPDDRGLPRQ